MERYKIINQITNIIINWTEKGETYRVLSKIYDNNKVNYKGFICFVVDFFI